MYTGKTSRNTGNRWGNPYTVYTGINGIKYSDLIMETLLVGGFKEGVTKPTET